MENEIIRTCSNNASISVLRDIELRDYQRPFFDAFTEGKKNKFMVVWPRRSGKTFIALYLAFRELEKPNSNVHYICFSWQHARHALWDAIRERFLEKKEGFNNLAVVNVDVNVDEARMSITFENGSVFSILSSHAVSLPHYVGSIIIDEPALFFEKELTILGRPDSKIIFIGTPSYRKDSDVFRDKYNVACKNKDEWFISHLTVDDTKNFDMDKIMKELQEGLMSKKKFFENFYTVFMDYEKQEEMKKMTIEEMKTIMEEIIDKNEKELQPILEAVFMDKEDDGKEVELGMISQQRLIKKEDKDD